MEPITQDEEREMRDVLERFYGPVAKSWNINYSTYELVGQLIAKSKLCTNAMHLVPRPWDLSQPVRWAQRQVRQAVVRYLRTPEGQHYIICMKAAAFGMRSDFEAASLGL